MLIACDPLMEIFNSNGELVKQDFDSFNIVSNDTNGKEKEHLIMPRQRTVRLTHLKTRLRLSKLKVKSTTAADKRAIMKA